MNSPCDFVWKARDNQPKPLTQEQFLSFLDGMDVKMTTEMVRLHVAQSEFYKIQLPAVTWQARFDGKLRNDANAQPTGMFCLDVDIHHEPEFKDILTANGKEAAIAWAEQEARERAERWARMQREEDSEISETANLDTALGIVGIHISPSGTGVHVIAYCHPSCKTIAENQARLARLLGTSHDEVCKDWARIFFLTPRKDWTYLDPDSIFGI
ncbi:MAG: hypothetical protein J6I86_04015 [Bacteroidaceae bacterium]|nr:hypothetical protein [Bacteroidaceae bacterium]